MTLVSTRLLDMKISHHSFYSLNTESAPPHSFIVSTVVIEYSGIRITVDQCEYWIVKSYGICDRLYKWKFVYNIVNPLQN